jgi:hypothetical protein
MSGGEDQSMQHTCTERSHNEPHQAQCEKGERKGEGKYNGANLL